MHNQLQKKPQISISVLSYIQENSVFFFGFFWQMHLLFGRIEPRQMPTWAGCVPASNTMNKAMQG